jgi:hypothetical protein
MKYMRESYCIIMYLYLKYFTYMCEIYLLTLEGNNLSYKDLIKSLSSLIVKEHEHQFGIFSHVLVLLI